MWLAAKVELLINSEGVGTDDAVGHPHLILRHMAGRNIAIW